MSYITYRAREEDGKEILEILESSPAKGSIELLYSRRPNAYVSYKKESKESDVLIVKDNEKIVGTVAQIVRDLYIDNEPKKMGYVCGFKKDSFYLGNLNCCKELIKNMVRPEIDGYYCSVISDNKEAQTIFEKRRRKTVNVEYLQDYTTYIMAPYFKLKVNDKGFEFKRAEISDEHNIIEFLNKEGKKKNFFPVFYSLKQYSNLDVTDFYILKYEGEIVAIGALWNQSEYKQYIVKKYRGIMKCAKLLNPILELLGYIRLPKENKVLDFPMLSFLISKNDSQEYYKVFLNNIVKVIKRDYGMFIIGMTKCNSLNKIFSNLRNIHFDSKIYTVDFILGNGKKQEIDRNNIWIECGLL